MSPGEYCRHAERRSPRGPAVPTGLQLRGGIPHVTPVAASLRGAAAQDPLSGVTFLGFWLHENH